MILGFTGSRAGLTPGQREQIAVLLQDATQVLHGDCIGADASFHEMALDAGVPIVVHPPDQDDRRAFCQGAAFLMAPAPYLTRNRAIVTFCDLLVAAPKETREPIPSRGQGTWSTVRYARKIDRPFVIVWPRTR